MNIIFVPELYFCTVCKQYDVRENLARFSRRATGHPECLLKKHGKDILRRLMPVDLPKFKLDVLRKYPGATSLWRLEKRAWAPAR